MTSSIVKSANPVRTAWRYFCVGRLYVSGIMIEELGWAFICWSRSIRVFLLARETNPWSLGVLPLSGPPNPLWFSATICWIPFVSPSDVPNVFSLMLPILSLVWTEDSGLRLVVVILGSYTTFSKLGFVRIQYTWDWLKYLDYKTASGNRSGIVHLPLTSINIRIHASRSRNSMLLSFYAQMWTCVSNMALLPAYTIGSFDSGSYIICSVQMRS